MKAVPPRSSTESIITLSGSCRQSHPHFPTSPDRGKSTLYRPSVEAYCLKSHLGRHNRDNRHKPHNRDHPARIITPPGMVTKRLLDCDNRRKTGGEMHEPTEFDRGLVESWESLLLQRIQDPLEVVVRVEGDDDLPLILGLHA